MDYFASIFDDDDWRKDDSDSGISFSFVYREPIEIIRIENTIYTSSIPLYNVENVSFTIITINDILLKIDELKKDTDFVESLYQGVACFHPTAFAGSSLTLITDDDQLIHPYIVLRLMGFDEHYDLPLFYWKLYDKYKLLENRIEFNKTEPVVAPFNALDYSSGLWHNWYSVVGFEQNKKTMRRVLGTYRSLICDYAKENKCSIVFIGDGYGVGYTVARDMCFDVTYLSTESDPVSIYVGSTCNNVVYVQKYTKTDILIYMHVDETVEWKFDNPCLVIGYQTEKYGGRGGIYTNFMPIKSVRIENETKTIIKFKNKTNIEYISRHEVTLSNQYQTIYLVREKSLVYSTSMIEDMGVNIVTFQSGVSHYVLSKMKIHDTMQYRVFNDGIINMYKINLRNNQVLSFYLDSKHYYFIGSVVNSITNYGDAYNPRPILNMKKNEVNILNGLYESFKSRGLHAHNCHIKCSCLLFDYNRTNDLLNMSRQIIEFTTKKQILQLPLGYQQILDHG